MIISLISVIPLCASSKLSDACRSRNAAVWCHLANIADEKDVKATRDVIKKISDEEERRQAEHELLMHVADLSIQHYNIQARLQKQFPEQRTKLEHRVLSDLRPVGPMRQGNDKKK